ncbi:NAD(P)/FAD-dependent oxidoreductase [Pseudalkalibacillus hwajinpoensis]|uniref:NAD(FAD)-utilizing dehydrogenase n=1 Tax=Guptibacillus hwajinpoensis TaxID=208199 RepID=A0A4U1MIT8_9BACL|nr:NAD(FAD)-utilizing dehydrogenase [Pseudalkalibacillus hwajinpoensis]TKD70455.1 NAD(FAD)-utilizing dehydrogenase [Pseudalkalibacillus hwajinpoensis]
MYDVAIIGAGVSGIFMAYKLTLEHPEYNIIMIDKGKQLSERTCKAESKSSCKCEVCDQYIGFGGLGKSEGKFNYTNDFGGSLGRKIGNQKAEALMSEVDDVICSFGGNETELYHTHSPNLQQRAEIHGLKVLTTSVRHLGTALSTAVFQKLYNYLSKRIDMWFETDVSSINKDGSFVLETNHGTVITEKVVISTGNSGGQWMYKHCEKLGLKPGPSRIDLGLRVEMRGNQLDQILKEAFETKLHIAGEGYEGTTYCMNPNGRIIRKYQHGLVMPDGQNKREEKTPGSNLNFTLFVPSFFDTKKEADQFAEKVIGGINQKRARIVVQRVQDLKNGRPTNDSVIAQNTIQPSLEAEGGSLVDEVPQKFVRALLEFLDALQNLLGEPIDDDTVVYGMDAKFYEPKIRTNEQFETEVPGLYLIGDCSGETHSLSQAAASGLCAAESI